MTDHFSHAVARISSAPSVPPAVGDSMVTPWYLAPQVVVAAVALVGTLLVTLVGKLYVDGRLARLGALALAQFEHDAAKELESLKVESARLRSERDAELTYRYESRRRLRESLHPLMSQLSRQASEAHEALHFFVENQQRWGSLDTEMRDICLFHLVAPQVTVSLIEARAVDLDLEVDPSIAETVHIAMLLRRSWGAAILDRSTDGGARLVPSEMLIESIPSRQYLHSSELDELVSMMRVPAGAGISGRCLSLTEFRNGLRAAPGLASALVPLRILVDSWEPEHSPILSRLLVAQDALLEILATGRADTLVQRSRSLRDDHRLLPLAEASPGNLSLEVSTRVHVKELTSRP